MYRICMDINEYKVECQDGYKESVWILMNEKKMLGWIYRICMDINECEEECQDGYIESI